MAELVDRADASRGPALMPDKVRVECFMLCDAAEQVNGKLFILGGGWNLIAPPAGQPFPLRHHHMALAVRLIVPWNDANRDVSFAVELCDEDGTSILPAPLAGTLKVGRPPEVTPGEGLPAAMAIGVADLVFPKPGLYAFYLLLDGDRAATLPLRVRPR